MNNLLDQYSPIYFLHKTEKWFPISFDYYIEKGVLVDANKNQRFDNLSTTFLYNYSMNNYPNQLARKDLWVETPKESLETKFNPETPVYGFIIETETTIDLYYVTIYTFNKGKNILGIAPTGDHEGDKEIIIVELKKNDFRNDTERINRIYYGSHSTEDGKWVKPSDVEFINTTHPVSYVAAGGHGNYNKPGVVFRYGGLANDYVGRHIQWDPKVVYLHFKSDPNFVPSRDGVLYFAGRWGFDGVSSIPDKGWFEAKPTPDILKPPPIFSMQVVIVSRIILYTTLLYIIYKLLNYGITLPTINKRIMYFSTIIALIAIVLGIVKYIVEKYA
jgi:hypothetical protein